MTKQFPALRPPSSILPPPSRDVSPNCLDTTRCDTTRQDTILTVYNESKDEGHGPTKAGMSEHDHLRNGDLVLALPAGVFRGGKSMRVDRRRVGIPCIPASRIAIHYCEMVLGF